MAARDIRALPKLEGTVHVNIALIVKFMPNYFFNPAEYPPVPRRDEPVNDEFLFHQGPAKGLGRIQFHDYNAVYDSFDIPNVKVFKQQADVFRDLLARATPDESQVKDTDFLLTLGEAFTQIVYGQLILENARIYGVDEYAIDQIFEFMVRDLSRHALALYGKAASTPQQMVYCLKMIRKPESGLDRFAKIYAEQVYPLKDAYEMNP
jgi:acyl-CoA dehydrogenase